MLKILNKLLKGKRLFYYSSSGAAPKAKRKAFSSFFSAVVLSIHMNLFWTLNLLHFKPVPQFVSLAFWQESPSI
jgi:hypothetical protein